MKFLSMLAAVPLLALGIGAPLVADDDIVTPEKLFPQLDAVLKQAVAQSPRMLSRAVDLEIAEQDRIDSRAVLLPSINGSYRYMQTSDSRADLPGRTQVVKQYYDLSLTQPLFYWGERRNSARMGVIRETLVKKQYREAYRMLADEIRTLYLTLVIDKVRVQRTNFFRDYAVNQQKLGEERLAKQTISESQIFGTRMEAERAQIVAERARFDFEVDKSSFARLTGTPVPKDEDLPDTIPPVPQQDEAVRRLLGGFLAQKDPPSAEADVVRESLKIERLKLAIAKTRLRPKFSALIGTNQDEQNYNVFVSQKYRVQSYFAGLTMGWTLFDGFSAQAGLRNAYSRVRQMEADYRQLTERLATQAQNQVQLLSFSTRLASINDRLLVAGQGGLRLRQEEFGRGVISEEAVSLAQLQTYDSELAALMARGDYFTQLQQFLGTVVEDPVLANLARR